MPRLAPRNRAIACRSSSIPRGSPTLDRLKSDDCVRRIISRRHVAVGNSSGSTASSWKSQRIGGLALVLTDASDTGASPVLALLASNGAGSGQYSLTKVPAPSLVSTNPSASRAENASSTVFRETPNCWLRDRVPGKRVPGTSRPLVIEVLISPISCILIVSIALGLSSKDNCMVLPLVKVI